MHETLLATISRASDAYERRRKIQDPALRDAMRSELRAAFIAGAFYSAEAEADRQYTSWNEVVQGTDLRAALDSARHPYGTAGAELARRALAGDDEALDAFAAHRHVTLVQIAENAGLTQETRCALLTEEARLQDDAVFRRDRLATAIHAGLLAVSLGCPLSEVHRAMLELCANTYGATWGASAATSTTLPNMIRRLLAALDVENRLLGPHPDECNDLNTASTTPANIGSGAHKESWAGPATAGFYWARRHKAGAWTVVEVSRVGDDFLLQAIGEACDRSDYFGEVTVAEWGPRLDQPSTHPA